MDTLSKIYSIVVFWFYVVIYIAPCSQEIRKSLPNDRHISTTPATTQNKLILVSPAHVIPDTGKSKFIY